MSVLNYTTVFKSLGTWIDNFNSKQIERKKKLKASYLFTAQTLLKIYGRQLVKKGIKKGTPYSQWPTLFTNSEQLATLTRSSARTMRRHILRLLDAGILIGKVFHGSNADYELEFSYELFEEQSDKGKGSFCPHTESTKLNNKLITGDFVEKSKMDEAIASTFQQNNHSKKGKKEKKKFWWDKSVKAKQSLSDERKSSAARAQKIDFFADLLWEMAELSLYKDFWLSEQEKSKGKALLKTWYDPVETENLARVHKVYGERIILVRKYLERSPRRFIPIPSIYFDPLNPTGFTGTRSWWKVQQRRKQEVKSKLIVHAQVQRIKHNDKKEAKNRVPPLKLFKDAEQKVRSMGNPILLKSFYEKVALLSNCKT